MNGFFAVAETRQTSPTSLLRMAGEAILTAGMRLVAARNRARTMRILSGLDDASLKDIGLARGQIDAVERDPRYTSRFPGF
jgi:uncharacterized protein YjiS (DUF1127 family)